MEIVLPFVTSQKADLQSYVCFSISFFKEQQTKEIKKCGEFNRDIADTGKVNFVQCKVL